MTLLTSVGLTIDLHSLPSLISTINTDTKVNDLRYVDL